MEGRHIKGGEGDAGPCTLGSSGMVWLLSDNGDRCPNSGRRGSGAGLEGETIKRTIGCVLSNSEIAPPPWRRGDGDVAVQLSMCQKTHRVTRNDHRIDPTRHGAVRRFHGRKTVTSPVSRLEDLLGVGEEWHFKTDFTSLCIFLAQPRARWRQAVNCRHRG